MRNIKYWEDTALLREIAVQDGATYTAAELLGLYDGALSDIKKEIKKIKQNYQLRYGLSDDEAAYYLTEAQQNQNLKNLIEALENTPSESKRREILNLIQSDGLSVRVYAARTERYKAIEAVIKARMIRLSADLTKGLKSILKSAYSEGYYGVIDDTAKGLDMGVSFSILNDRAIEEAVSAKWHGKRFSERIWGNTQRLADEAQSLVIKSLMSGESNVKMAKKLTDSFGTEKRHAVTLIRTETAHVHAMADKRAYEDLGIEEYKYLATLDYKTCETCQPLDGKVFKISDMREGKNYPVMHPRCRCTTTMNIDYKNRRARNPLTGKNEVIDGSVTYDEWLNSLSDEQRRAIEVSRRKDSQRAADKLQYAKYKNVLGKENLPKTFDLFQDLKYNDSEKWDELKLSYKDTKLQNKIRSEYNLVIHEGKQGKHILGHNNYTDGRSYLTISLDEAQELVNKYAGTGEILRDRKNQWTNKELIKYDTDIGVIVNLKGEKNNTSKFTIHYGKNGTHIVPGGKGKED